jgi:phosphoribosyl-AMP cyclohydrolase
MSHARDEGTHLDPAWDANGLITAVVCDAASGAVLMLAHMNDAALAATLATGEAHFWSRSRRELWHKGATSGNILKVQDIRVDCDQDAILLLVEPAGPACHTGRQSCFYRRLTANGLELLA